MNSIYKTILIVTFVITFNAFAFGQTEREKGIELFKGGNYAEAVRYLERAAKQKAFQKDGEIWNYIGLAYTNQNKEKDARKAFEKAVKFDPQSSVYRANLAYAWLLDRKTDRAQSEINKAIQLDPKNAKAYYFRGTANMWENRRERALADALQAIALDPKFAAAYILQSDALMASFGEKWADESKPTDNLNLLERAGESLKKCLSDCPKDASYKIVSDRAETVKAFLDYFKRTQIQKDNSGVANENITPLKITYKPKQRYTDRAREANVSGSIRVAVMFGADGKTKYHMVIQGLGYGLDEEAVAAARGIGFEPEKIDGKPVSVVKVVVFSFSIY